MDLYDIAVAKKLSGSSGGGGSSDFSTAQVTIISSCSGSGTFYNSEVYSVILYENAFWLQAAPVPRSGESTFEIALYKTAPTPLTINNNRLQTMPTVTGGITIEDGEILVTGDGTITIELT